MKWINSFFSWLIKKRLHQIELFMKYPVEVQEELFNKLIQKSINTEWGKLHKYTRGMSVSEFQQKVPVSTYEDLKPYIDRIRKGQQNILWPSETKMFAKSSGTTSAKSKFIPVSPESMKDCHLKAGKDMIAIYCNNYPETKFFTGKGIAISGSHSIQTVNSEEYYTGDLSALLITNLPLWVKFIRVPNKSIALMDDWELKIENIIKNTINKNVVSLAGVSSWTILLLERLLKVSEKKHVCEVWPDIEVYFHGGVNFAPYRSRFKELFKKDVRLMETYNASEGYFGIEDVPGSNELLLMLDCGIFFEFIPLDQIEIKHPETKSLDEVELGKPYALIISTNAGLWRYQIGDTVIFTSKYPFRFKIAGRTKSFINLAGEELMVENAENAILKACQKTNAVINEFTAGPFVGQNGKKSSHHWLIEFIKEPEDISFFGEMLDNALKSVNSDYEAKRYNNMILSPPHIEAIPEGTFYKWLKYKGKLGGQHKVPRLSNSPDIINEIRKMLNC